MERVYWLYLDNSWFEDFISFEVINHVFEVPVHILEHQVDLFPDDDLFQFDDVRMVEFLEDAHFS